MHSASDLPEAKASSNETNSPTSPFYTEPIADFKSEKVGNHSSQESLHRTYSSINAPATGVNVQRAEQEFAELSKQLSRASHHSRLSRQQSRHGPKRTDEEKTVGISPSESIGTEDRFDLEATLRGNKSEEEAAGIKSKNIGVIWDKLSVSGEGGVKNFVRTFPYAFVSFFNVYAKAKNMLGLGKKGNKFDILQGFRGVVKPGEMVLVLGRPGSGCTTFLKVIANQRYGYTNVDGEVLYGPFDHALFEKRYRGEAVYNDEVRFPFTNVRVRAKQSTRMIFTFQPSQ
jgi:ATP-binding cassette subfamily G (WHITE) protein 2 (SNQ2)